MILVITVIALAMLLVSLLNIWLIPWANEHVKDIHCFSKEKMTDLRLFLYGSLAGLPLFIAFMLVIFEGKTIIRTIQSAQFPPPGKKVIKPTRYVYGAKAKRRAYLLIFVVVCIFGLGIGAYVGVGKFIENVQHNLAACEDIP